MAVWASQVVPLLEREPMLNAVTLLEELQRRHPGGYAYGVLRTLQRRVRQWRALHGAEREVYFAQAHPPGRLGLSDFTVADELAVVIEGQRFDHRLYQFALAHSGWRHAEVVEGGERFLALSAGLQGALWRLGGAPEEDRTDSLSAAFNNLAEREELTRRYEGLCGHYRMRASRCNPGQSHENGAIESRHRSLKTALDQAQRLRGSRCFAGRPQGATIFLSHSPRGAETAARAGAGLMLSGHTHGGQIWPFDLVVRLFYPFLAGHYQVEGMTIVVCRGTGSWGPRMRLWRPGEILRIVLRGPAAAV